MLAPRGFERLAFFGTPDFAVPTLAALLAAGRAPLVVVTQPSRPVGRGGRTTMPPVATLALERGVRLLQPEKVRDEAFLGEIAALDLDLAIVVAFGQIFPRRLLDLPRAGCMNLHASLLPAYRGAAPIQAAIAAGDSVTGVTTMHMEAGLDSGPILLSRTLAVGEHETAGELSPRLAELGAQLVLETIAALERGEITPQAQDDALATFAPRLTREAGRVDWTLAADVLSNRYRAFTPWPGLSAELRGEPVKLFGCRARPNVDVDSGDRPPGSVLGVVDGALEIACGAGTRLAVGSLQRPGRRALAAADFANGERLGDRERFA